MLYLITKIRSMATVNVVLRKKPTAQMLYPIAIRLTRNRKTSYIFTGQNIDESYWDDTRKRVKKTHPNSARLNQLILKKLSEANDKLLESESFKDFQSVRLVKRNIIKKNKSDFFEIADKHLNSLRDRKKFHHLKTEKGRIDKLRKFIGQDFLPFTELTVSLIKEFEAYLLTVRKVSPRTVTNYLMLIRTIFNRGISEGVVERMYYPFGRGKVSIKILESEKVGLNIEEVKKLETASELTDAQQSAIDVWLLSFYFAGVRVGDILKLNWSDFNDGRLLYRMGKNDKLVSLKIPEKAETILGKYRNHKMCKTLIFPYLAMANMKNQEEVSIRVRSVTRNLNRRLKLAALELGINKKLTMHIARHTFGNISGDKIPIQMLQKLYRHSSVTTTINYQANFMNRDTDEALDSVVNF